jgi:DNA-binding GntR family transcriptional regulator
MVRNSKRGDNIRGILTPAKTLSEQAYERLEEKIISLQLPPGEILSEAALAKDLDIGRTPIREALQKLVRTGLVVILPHKGILVTEINPLKQLQLLELRQALENLMVRSAAIRSTKEQKGLFNELAELMEKAANENDELNFMSHDDSLHNLISQAANNEYLSRAMELYHSLCRRFWYMHNKESADISYSGKLHAELARKLALGDPEKAVEANNRLISYLVEVTRATLNIGGAWG